MNKGKATSGRKNQTGISAGCPSTGTNKLCYIEMFHHLKGSTCIEDTPEPPKISVEAQLVACLRRWRVDPHAVLDHGRTLEREIYGLLEWFICGCIAYGPRNLRSWWSDGIIHLEITHLGCEKLKLIGVTWIDCHGTAPFEIDVELDPADDHHFAKTIFRIGMLDDRGTPKLCHRNLAVGRVLDMRPRYDRHWAMAVELTPPESPLAKERREPESR